VVACHQNQCRQNFNGPLLPSGQYCDHGVQYLPVDQKYIPIFRLEALVEESTQKKEKAEIIYFYLLQQLLRKTNLDPIVSESRFGTIAHKSKKRITALSVRSYEIHTLASGSE
jgi:hypothetical protein